MLHPGFNRTGMTAKYSEIWDKVYKHLPIWMCDKNLECTRPFCCLTHENRTVHSPSHNRATFHVRQEGAVDPSVGAKRVLHEIGQVTMEKSGSFINCEDGLQIPW